MTRGPLDTAESLYPGDDVDENDRNYGRDISDQPIFDQVGGAVRITIDTDDTSAGNNGTGSIYIAEANTTRSNFDDDGDLVSTFELPSELADASTFKFGFVAGTGGAAINADIWSASVDSIDPIPAPEFVTTASQCLVSTMSNSLTLSAENGVAPYTYAIAENNSLPAGMSLSAGVISGTPSTVGNFSTTINLTDSSSPNSRTASRTFTFNVTSACEPSIGWQLNGNDMQIGPTGSDQDGSCTGNTGTYSQSNVGGYRIAQFTATDRATDASCTWSPPSGVFAVEVLVVGGLSLIHI